MFKEKLVWHTNRSVPIVLVDKAIDEIAVVKEILQTYETDPDGYQCLYVWDTTRGLRADVCRQPKAADAYQKEAIKVMGDGESSRPDTALEMCGHILNASLQDNKEYKCGFVFFMGDRIVSERHNDSWQVVVQRLLNMRDTLKHLKSCIYLVGINFTIPPELEEHVAVIPAELPDNEQYAALVQSTYAAYSAQYEKRKEQHADIPKFELTDEEREKMVGILQGMSEFNAEQTMFLSTDMRGIHTDKLRDRAIQTINATRGLSVITGDGMGFRALGGLDSIKAYASRLLSGNFKPKLIVFSDEVDKALAGVGSDSSGVSGNIFGAWLSEMQDTRALGLMLTGVPGAAKSAFALRLGEEAKTLTVRLDISGLKDSLVGGSESNMRRALETIRSIGGDDGGIVYVATCNRIGQLPPEFKRRFNLGTYFFGFPDDTEKLKIWEIYRALYGLMDDSSKVDDTNWTGAEIESCCRLAHLMQCTLAESAERIVPVSKVAETEIEKLMEEAEGKFLSASQMGTFKRKKSALKEYTEGKRELNL